MKVYLIKTLGSLIILLLAVTVATSAYADDLAFENEPTGFRGIRWDTQVLKVPGLVLSEKDGDIKVYNKTNEVNTLGGAALDGIQYTFYRDRFYSVYITFSNPLNYDALKKYMFSVYDYGQSESTMWRKRWWWMGENVNIRLDYSMIMRQGTLCFTYIPLYLQYEAALLEAARGGVGEY